MKCLSFFLVCVFFLISCDYAETSNEALQTSLSEVECTTSQDCQDFSCEKFAGVYWQSRKECVNNECVWSTYFKCESSCYLNICSEFKNKPCEDQTDCQDYCHETEEAGFFQYSDGVCYNNKCVFTKNKCSGLCSQGKCNH